MTSRGEDETVADAPLRDLQSRNCTSSREGPRARRDAGSPASHSVTAAFAAQVSVRSCGQLGKRNFINKYL